MEGESVLGTLTATMRYGLYYIQPFDFPYSQVFVGLSLPFLFSSELTSSESPQIDPSPTVADAGTQAHQDRHLQQDQPYLRARHQVRRIDIILLAWHLKDSNKQMC